MSWQDVRPLRVNDTDASILKTNFQTGYLYYKSQGPSFVIYSLDCFALIMKMFHYFRNKQNGRPSDIDVALFLHDEIIVPSVLRDTATIWLRNAYQRQLISEKPLRSLTMTEWDEINPDSLGPSFTYAMQELQKFKFSNNQPMLPFSSFHMGSEIRFIDYYKTLYSGTRLPDNKAYIWVNVVKNLAWWEFVILINSFSASHPSVRRLNTTLRRELYLWLNLKPWLEIKGSAATRESLERKLKVLYKYLTEQ